MGNASAMSSGTSVVWAGRSPSAVPVVVHWKRKSPGTGWTAQTASSAVICAMRRHDMAMRQSSTQLSITNSCEKNRRSGENTKEDGGVYMGVGGGGGGWAVGTP